jgi:two-component system, HptB-dependent secretion and biofilm response regulator
MIEHNIKKLAINDVIKALIIEDSKLDQLILKKILINDGYDVSIASTGHMAMEILNEYQPDIVFMDLNLPDTNGYELTKMIKNMSQEKYIPVIFVTAISDDESLGKCLESGANDFIVKPIKENLLKAKVNSLLRVKKMHDELLLDKETILNHRDGQLKDLHDADKVIHNILEARFYNSGNLDWLNRAKNILSGDIICSAVDPSGNHVILLGDNTGHGLPAAIGAIFTSEIFYSMVNKGFDIQLIIEEINKKLYYALPIDRFLATSILEIDSKYHTVKIWNAGMPDILVCDSEGVLKEKLPSIHLPLGIVLVKESDIVPIRVDLEKGDRIYAYSDGLIECFNIFGEMYGELRLLDSIKSNHDLDKRVGTIINDSKKFSSSPTQSDDILLLEINCDKTLIKKKKRKINFNRIVPMNWRIQFDFQADIICNSNPIPALVQRMVDIQGFGDHREKIFLILTEMYSNTVEHGILDLNSAIKEEEDGFEKYYDMRQLRLDELTGGNVSIDIKHYIEGKKGIISITMKDNGAGFDYTQTLADISIETRKSGRGISLLNDLCRKVEYSDGGRNLNIEYEWEFIGTHIVA